MKQTDAEIEMESRNAIEFLIEQVVEQAGLEEVPLSDLEKRMIAYTESDPSVCANPVVLNKEFEAACDTSEFESKIASLLQHAYKRLSAADGEKQEEWDAAIQSMSTGDYYILVLWNLRRHRDERSWLVDRLLLVLTAVLVVSIVLAYMYFADR